MGKFLRILLKFLCLATLYFVSLYRYAPSDVTQGLWAFKLGVIFLFMRIFGIFFLYLFIKMIFFSKGRSFFGRLFSTILALPFYALASALILIALNGYNDDGSRTIEWRTNLVYFRDFKLVFLTAGLDDAQIDAQDLNPQLVMVPGKLCSHVATHLEAPTDNRIHVLTLSSGAYGIPYVTDIKR